MKPTILIMLTLCAVICKAQIQPKVHYYDTMALPELKNRSKALFAVGAVFSSIGSATMLTYTVVTIGKSPNLNTSVLVYSTAATSSISGIVLMCIGARDLKVYRRRSEALSFKPSPTGLGFAMKF